MGGYQASTKFGFVASHLSSSTVGSCHPWPFAAAEEEGRSQLFTVSGAAFPHSSSTLELLPRFRLFSASESPLTDPLVEAYVYFGFDGGTRIGF